jgi:7-keto-8-aminopelargonate synthetase-like enzyme
VNLRQGEQRRARLAALVRRLQDGAGTLGHRIGPAQFPVQALERIDGISPVMLYRRLLDLRVRAVLHRPACRPVPTCTFLITASHTPEQIDRALAALSHATAGPAAPSGPGQRRPPAGAFVTGSTK